jgi:EAL domain-containing protein (putative c-di-GMP-specific phosphodiesterase class I)
MPLIVEGIETQEELQAVQALGIHLAQGFLFGPAVDVPGREQLAFPAVAKPFTEAPA